MFNLSILLILPLLALPLSGMLMLTYFVEKNQQTELALEQILSRQK